MANGISQMVNGMTSQQMVVCTVLNFPPAADLPAGFQYEELDS